MDSWPTTRVPRPDPPVSVPAFAPVPPAAGRRRELAVPRLRRADRGGPAVLPVRRPPPSGPETRTGPRMGAGAFRRAQRAANGGAPVEFDAGPAWQVVAFRVVLVVLALVLVASQVGPWGPEVRALVAGWVTSVSPVRF
ncbi:hypothetical protein BJF78_17650 [Pseudonocardia sp. CNS-139]|nr:hypothetical protein BJF78_17650 [Pseudonocardia sp. CNS-139]